MQAFVGAIVAWFASFLGKKLGLAATFLTLLTTFYGTMLIVVGAAIAGVSAVVPQWFFDAAAMFLPSQTGAAMAAVMTARVARWIYDTSVRVATLTMQVG